MKNIGLLFSGQGSQVLGMGFSLYQNNASARKLFDFSNDILGFDIKTACFEGPEELLTQTAYCQPALYIHGFAIYTILKENGCLEGLKALFGLSLGELTALAAAQVYDFQTGLQMVAKRGAFMQEACLQTQGSMASLLGGSLELARDLCEEFGIDLANLNCPGQIVISGERSRVEEAVAKAKELSFKRVIPLNVAGAYHSRLMAPAAQKFKDFISDTPFKAPQVSVFTNTTGQSIQDPILIKEALVKQITAPVLFEDCLVNASLLGIEMFYECGPGSILSGLVKRTLSTPCTSLGEYSNLEPFLHARG